MKDQISKMFGLSERSTHDEVKNIPIDQIVPSPYQPREVFEDERIDELCQTIRTHGIIQPIVVRKQDDQYEIIAGERRFRAVKKLEMETIPAIIKDFNDSQAASIALIENLQREGLSSIEEANAYQKLMDMHDLTQESLAQRVGKSQSTIANKIRLLQLSDLVKNALAQRKITERHARALLTITDHTKQVKLLHEIIDKDLNVKQTEMKIKSSLNKPKKSKPKRISFSKDVRLAVNTIRQSIGMVVDTGMDIQTDELEKEDHYEIVIKIPKN